MDPMPLLIARADDMAHADRAYGRMLTWILPYLPSQYDEQINEALRLTKDGTGREVRSKFDPPPKTTVKRNPKKNWKWW